MDTRWHLLLSLLLLFPGLLKADPQVTIDPQLLKEGKRVLFEITQEDLPSMEAKDCHYNLFAADKKRDLRSLPGRGLSIATFFRAEPSLAILASHLRRLSRSHLKKRHATVHLRMLMPCDDGDSYLSDYFQLRIPTSKKGRVRKVDVLIRRMKYHMRWADEVSSKDCLFHSPSKKAC